MQQPVENPAQKARTLNITDVPSDLVYRLKKLGLNNYEIIKVSDKLEQPMKELTSQTANFKEYAQINRFPWNFQSLKNPLFLIPTIAPVLNQFNKNVYKCINSSDDNAPYFKDQKQLFVHDYAVFASKIGKCVFDKDVAELPLQQTALREFYTVDEIQQLESKYDIKSPFQNMFLLGDATVFFRYCYNKFTKDASALAQKRSILAQMNHFQNVHGPIEVQGTALRELIIPMLYYNNVDGGDWTLRQRAPRQQFVIADNLDNSLLLKATQNQYMIETHKDHFFVSDFRIKQSTRTKESCLKLIESYNNFKTETKAKDPKAESNKQAELKRQTESILKQKGQSCFNDFISKLKAEKQNKVVPQQEIVQEVNEETQIKLQNRAEQMINDIKNLTKIQKEALKEDFNVLLEKNISKTFAQLSQAEIQEMAQYCEIDFSNTNEQIQIIRSKEAVVELFFSFDSIIKSVQNVPEYIKCLKQEETDRLM